MSQNFDYMMSRWQVEQKGERERDNERILKIMVAQSGKMSFLSVFYFDIVFM